MTVLAHFLTLLNDSSEAHLALWRVRAALPDCSIKVDGKDVLIAAHPGSSVERTLAHVPNLREHLSW